MEIVLDKVLLDSSTTTRHLLDSDFSGAFSPGEDALKRKLGAFRERYARRAHTVDPAARCCCLHALCGVCSPSCSLRALL